MTEGNENIIGIRF